MDARLASAGDRDGMVSLVVGLLRMVFPTQIAALTMKIAPSAAGVFPVVAGTGRTIVALHGAAHLARTRPDARVLLTTFSDSLANALQKQAEAIAR